jgi:hypothetical protein
MKNNIFFFFVFYVYESILEATKSANGGFNFLLSDVLVVFRREK